MSNDRDLNLLSVFDAIWTERNITRVSEKLFITQPAVSHSLKKLRDQFGDPLFVRGANGVVPTDFAKDLAPKVKRALSSIDEIYDITTPFSPKDQKRDIRLAVGDFFAMTLFRNFQERINAEAPKVNMIAKTVTEVFPNEDMENGHTDLVLSGFFATAKAPRGFHKKIVFEEPFYCVCRKDHPLAKKGKVFTSYLKADHLFVSPIGSLHGFIDQDLEKVGKTRNVTTVLPGFPETGPTLARSDLVLTAPKGLCDALAESHDLVSYKLPVEIRSYRACVLWHERTNEDPFHNWVREVLFDVFEEYRNLN